MIDILTSIRRTPYQSLAAFLVLFFTLFLSIGLFLSLSFLHGLLTYVETRPQVLVYFKTKATDEEINKVRQELVSSGKVSSVEYVTKDEAFAIFKEKNKDKPMLFEMISSNIFPVSLKIRAKEPQHLSQITEYLNKQIGVDEVQFPKDISDRLISLTDALRKISIVLFSYLIVMSVIVLSTTTLFKIALKKDEIELYRLLGATNFYIKKPYLGEGMLFGFVAAVCAFIVTVGILFYMNPFLTAYFRGIPSLSTNFGSFMLTVWPINMPFLLITLALSALFGMGISLIASFIATEKYLS